MVPELVAPGLGHQVLGKKEDQGMEEEGWGGEQDRGRQQPPGCLQLSKKTREIGSLFH